MKRRKIKMATSRVRLLEQTLDTLQYYDSLRALDLVMQEMCKEKGFSRHNGTHYYYHLVDVTQKLLNFGVRDQDIITASLLHDIVEDVEGFTLNVIEKLFNANVAKIVALVTKDANVDYKKDKESLQKYLDKISDNLGASLIKTSDRLHNLSTIRDATQEKKLRQALETEEYFIPFFKVCRNKYPRFSKFFFEAKTTLEPHIWEIKEHHQEVSELKYKITELEKELAKYK